jgi:broad-specificity NMP kinase
MTTEHASPATPSTTPPASSWIKFLRSYGPTPNNTALFDEYVTTALRRANVQPITLSSPQLDAIKERVNSGVPGSILIAGTAGDGKTYHCRGLWAELGGTAKEWADASAVKEVTLGDGRIATFIKDLSELTPTQSDKALAMLEASVLGLEDRQFVVIAANHGQILERLRDMGIREGRVHPLRKSIQDAFLQAGEAPARLGIFDLSRATRRDTLSEVLSAVANHPDWDKCGGCTRNGVGAICPIFENRNRLLGAEDNGRFASRLGDVVEVARLNGWHLPVRDMLALASNMVLGHPEAKEGLMVCADVPKIQEKNTVEKASLYGNAFGANLPARRAMSRPVFRALAAFSIGSETTNAADGLMVYGADDTSLAPTFDRLLRNDPIFGATAGYLASLERYLEGEEAARLDSGAGDFLARLQAQRRRFFFTLPQAEPGYDHWPMTAFRFAGDYLAMTKALASSGPINEGVRSRLVKGLNRVMTGLLIENDDKLFVASSGGFSQSRISVLCDTEAPARRQGGRGMRIRLDAAAERPLLDVALEPSDAHPAAFLLTPVRFEFLCRVAEGALPGSFSNECLEDMLAFKAKLLRKEELMRKKLSQDDEEPDADDGSLSLNFIDVEQSGLGLSRRVTVRAGA